MRRRRNTKYTNKSLIRGVLSCGSIVTTVNRAKLMRSKFDHLVTYMKDNSMDKQNFVKNFVGKDLFDRMSRYSLHMKDRDGGYLGYSRMKVRSIDGANLRALFLLL